MIFKIQDLTFNFFGLLALEGYAAFAARCVVALLLAAVGEVARRWLRGWVFPQLRRIPWPSRAIGILLDSFASPASWLALTSGLYLAVASLPWGTVPMEAFLLKLYRFAIILLLSWGLYGASELTDLMLANAREEIRTNRTLHNVLVKVYKVVVAVLGILMAVQEWGLPVTGVITSAGLVGLTISLAAQDTASNLFGGVMILVERPFQIGDWIVVGSVEGTVEDISFRSTRVRALDNSVYILTNSNVCASTINNAAQRQKRLYRFTLGVEYGATRAQLEKLMEDLRAMLAASPHTYEESVIVELTGFGASSIDLLVSAYLRTADTLVFYKMQNDLNLDVMDIVRADGLDFAFPSTSVYVKEVPAAQRPEQEVQTHGN